jgi:hypothetical protein
MGLFFADIILEDEILHFAQNADHGEHSFYRSI